MTIIIPKKAYLPIIAASTRFANQTFPQEEWLEVSGIFIGKNKGKKVIISESYPIMHQEYDKDAIIDQYVWSDEDMILASDIEMEAFENKEFMSLDFLSNKINRVEDYLPLQQNKREYPLIYVIDYIYVTWFHCRVHCRCNGLNGLDGR